MDSHGNDCVCHYFCPEKLLRSLVDLSSSIGSEDQSANIQTRLQITSHPTAMENVKQKKNLFTIALHNPFLATREFVASVPKQLVPAARIIPPQPRPYLRALRRCITATETPYLSIAMRSHEGPAALGAFDGKE